MDESNYQQKYREQTKSERKFGQEQSDKLSEHTIFVGLPKEPEMANELETIIQIVRDRANRDVAIDFSMVDVVTSSSLSKLLKLRKLLTDNGHRLVLYNVSKVTKSYLAATGFDGLFELADDKFISENVSKPSEIVRQMPESVTGTDEALLLTPEQERLLGKRVVEENDPLAREQLVRSNLKLVVNTAKKYTGRGMSLGDLIEEGNLGLIKAVDYFDPDRGTRFSTYAAWWIKQSIKCALLENVQPVHIPAYMVALINQWRRIAAELENRLGRTPDIEEMVKIMYLPLRKAKIIHQIVRILSSARDTFGSDEWDESQMIEPILQDQDAGKLEDALDVDEEKARVSGLLNQIDPRAANILRLRYGLDGQKPLTLKQTGEKLGLTREKIRQIQHEALTKLYEYMTMDESDPRKKQPKGKGKFNQEQYDILLRCSGKKEILGWNNWRKKHYREEIHLEGAKLKGAYLEGANLRNAHLEKSDLKNAHMQHAILEKAHLEHAKLHGAHLENADMSGAHLKDTKLIGAHLEGANLSGADLRGANLEKTNFESAVLEGVKFDDQNLLSKAQKYSRIFEEETDEEETCGGRALVLEIEAPDNVADDKIKSVVLELVEHADSFYRAVGGHGLKIGNLHTSEGKIFRQRGG